MRLHVSTVTIDKLAWSLNDGDDPTCAVCGAVTYDYIHVSTSHKMGRWCCAEPACRTWVSLTLLVDP